MRDGVADARQANLLRVVRVVAHRQDDLLASARRVGRILARDCVYRTGGDARRIKERVEVRRESSTVEVSHQHDAAERHVRVVRHELELHALADCQRPLIRPPHVDRRRDRIEQNRRVLRDGERLDVEAACADDDVVRGHGRRNPHHVVRHDVVVERRGDEVVARTRRVVDDFVGPVRIRRRDERELRVIAVGQARQLEARDRIDLGNVNGGAVEADRAGRAELHGRAREIHRAVLVRDGRVDNRRADNGHRVRSIRRECHRGCPAHRERLKGDARVDFDLSRRVHRQRRGRVVVHLIDRRTLRDVKRALRAVLRPCARLGERAVRRDRARVESALRDVGIGVEHRLGLRVADRIVEHADDVHDARLGIVDRHIVIDVIPGYRPAEVGADLNAGMGAAAVRSAKRKG